MTILLTLALVASPAIHEHSSAWEGERPWRETTLLKAMPVRDELRTEIREEWERIVEARRERREKAAAHAAMVAAEAAAAVEAPAPAVPAVPTGGSSSEWGDELAAVGFPPEVIGTMLAIIDRESGGNPSAVNPSSGACGLLQLYPCPSGGLDPMTNLRLGYAKYRASGLSPWGM